MRPLLSPTSTATPPDHHHKATDPDAYRSTPDSRSSVLSRAREYTRRLEDENRRRSKSLDRQQTERTQSQAPNDSVGGSTTSRSFETADDHQSAWSTPSPTYRTARPTSLSSAGSSSGGRRNPRSHSAGGDPSSSGNRLSSVEKENSRNNDHGHPRHPQRQQLRQPSASHASPPAKVTSAMSGGHHHPRPTPATTMSASSHGPQERLQRPAPAPSPAGSFARRGERTTRGPRGGGGGNGGGNNVEEEEDEEGDEEPAPHEAVVSPELLVDALSGHEDGLLAIAERLMEHYDSGYDAMGEAIIDAFADVQKLFQHVVEAAHMEGAAFEASRREEELALQKQQQRDLTAAGGGGDGAADGGDDDDALAPSSPAGPMRHDEFIDQDVKDCLNDAIRRGAALKERQRHDECFHLYEGACQNASSLLPVDSDHRGRLQLSIARAESMSPDRGCAILRYAMDDVLRSGLRAGKVPLPDLSKRADVVLSKPKGHPSMVGSAGSGLGVVQSSEEALNSLVEEMKEIMDAPVYKDTPLQDVAKRFWAALQENKKISSKNEERLEHNLGKLKGDFLLARAEWEEKLNHAQEQAEIYKRKYATVKDGKETSLMEEARTMMSQRFAPNSAEEEGAPSSLGGQSKSASFRAAASRPEFQKGVESVASMGSNLAQHAKTLVGSFACAGSNERTGQVLVSERATEEWRGRRSAARDNRPQSQPAHSGLEISNSQSTMGGSTPTYGTNRSFRETTTTGNGQAPRHVDV